jgi:frataxin-like iron-binding protein CyaY
MNRKFKHILSLNEFLNETVLETKNEVVNEAYFSSEKIEDVLNLILSWVMKQTSTVFSFNFHFENIKQDNEVLWGIRFVGVDGSIFRINWGALPKTNSAMIYSVDFWDKDNLTTVPKYKVYVKDFNIVQILTLITSYINGNGDYTSEFYNSYVDADKYVAKSKDEDILVKNLKIDESLTDQEMSEYNFLKSKIRLNPTQIPIQDKKKFAILSLKKEGYGGNLDDIFNFEEVGVEENIEPQELEMESKFEEMVATKNIESKFKDLSFLVKTVANGIRPCFVATGTPGVGKSYTVSKTMKELGLIEGKDWLLVKGSTTPFGMYQIFCNYPKDYIIVFDDCDSVFDNINGINILKGALDTNQIRNISWKSRNTFSTVNLTQEEIDIKMKSGKYPDNITISSGVIFLTNIKNEDLIKNSELEAIISRAGSPIDLTFSDEDIFGYIESLIDKIDIMGLDIDYKKEVFDVMRTAYENKTLKTALSFRTFINMVKSKYSYDTLWFNAKMLGDPFEYSDDEWIRLSVSYS